MYHVDAWACFAQNAAHCHFLVHQETSNVPTTNVATLGLQMSK